MRDWKLCLSDNEGSKDLCGLFLFWEKEELCLSPVNPKKSGQDSNIFTNKNQQQQQQQQIFEEFHPVPWIIHWEINQIGQTDFKMET